MRLVFLAIALASTAAAAAEEPHPVTAKLVIAGPDRTTGESARVGVLFEIEKGWHIYWKNPGDSGLATSIDLDLPEGAEAGPLQWPIPVSFSQPGEIAGFGYEGSVLLYREIVVTEGHGKPVRASASWLACKDKCVQGEADLGEVFPGSAPDHGSAELFALWKDRMPIAGASVAEALHQTIRPGSGPGEVTLLFSWAHEPAAVEVFPDPGDTLRITSSRVATRGGLTRVDLAFRAMGRASNAPTHLRSLVVATDPDGRRRGYSVVSETNQYK